ncbi:hypothetical protein [Rhodoferax sp.]|uniref:hypothetical protein n=1 Tax=Rhodoferax sp. TaxID=50421 RepID=UPI00274EAC9D|nr:hypothetical protein [Rhodoferax sp.]
MATPNYGYEKRQKELAKKRKKEEKLKHKAERKVGDPEQSETQGQDVDSGGDTPAPGTTEPS